MDSLSFIHSPVDLLILFVLYRPILVSLTPIFSRPYLSNGRAVVMVVVRPSVVCHGCIVAKRGEIGPRLLLIIDGKSHIGFQMI